MKNLFYFAIIFMSVATFAAGCAPSYPKGTVDEAIVRLCREEYGVETKVKILGDTLGVYIPVEKLFDMTFNISTEAAEKINDVMLSITRVALSTDAPLDFYIVIAQDPALPEVEIILLRYIMDIKKFYLNNISRGEFAKRMIIDKKLTPQAQKEKALRGIFDRLNIKESENLITEYMKTNEAVNIGDIGYWQDTFFMKDLDMGEFLGLQIAERARNEFLNTSSLSENFKLNTVKGEFLQEAGKDFFRFSFDIAPLTGAAPSIGKEEADAMFNIVLKTASDVLQGYKFEDFWNIEIVNSNDNEVVFASLDELEGVRKKKVGLKELRRWRR